MPITRWHGDGQIARQPLHGCRQQIATLDFFRMRLKSLPGLVPRTALLWGSGECGRGAGAVGGRKPRDYRLAAQGRQYLNYRGYQHSGRSRCAQYSDRCPRSQTKRAIDAMRGVIGGVVALRACGAVVRCGSGFMRAPVVGLRARLRGGVLHGYAQNARQDIRPISKQRARHGRR